MVGSLPPEAATAASTGLYQKSGAFTGSFTLLAGKRFRAGDGRAYLWQKKNAMNPLFKDRRVLIGIALVVVALLVLLRNFDLIPYELFPYWLFSWKTAFIVGGLVALGNRTNKTVGVVLISIGLFNLLPDVLGVPRDVLRKLFIPAVLLGIGLLFIFRQRLGSGADWQNFGGNFRSPRAIPGLSTEYINEFAMMGGGERVITSVNFKGGSASALMGSLKLNLMGAQLAEGDHVLDVMTLMGGTEIILPKEWNVKPEVMAIFGGVDDKRRPLPGLAIDSTRTLFIRGVALFGGVEIKSY